jgi:uncharacterized integral membrane protein
MTEVRSGETKPRRRVTAKLVLVLVLIVLAVIFIAQNRDSHEIDVLFWTVSAATWIWLLIMLVIGVVIGSMFPWLRSKKK